MIELLGPLGLMPNLAAAAVLVYAGARLWHLLRNGKPATAPSSAAEWMAQLDGHIGEVRHDIGRVRVDVAGLLATLDGHKGWLQSIDSRLTHLERGT